jgi:hypothetical protein
MSWRGFLSLSLLLAASPASAGAEMRIENGNGNGEGLNDPTPVDPEGGNPGTTIGEQRRIAFQYAASLWAATLGNRVPITVRSEFIHLDCTGGLAVLGAAGPVSLYEDGRYPAALANERAGKVLDSGKSEIEARFSTTVGTSGCDVAGWYYGLDNAAPAGRTDLVSVVLHELAHGLGFIKSAGVFKDNVQDDSSRRLLSELTGASYDAAIRRPMNVSWVGPEVRSQKNGFLDRTDGLLRVPANGASYFLAQARFGGAPQNITAPLVLAHPAAGGTNGDACESIAPAPGKLVMADRNLHADGSLTCFVAERALNAQAAGAVGLIVRHGQPGGVPVSYGSSDAGVDVTIPVWGISQEDGQTLENALGPGGGTVTVDATGRRAGENVAGDVLLYTPTTFSDGSSLGHWDSSAQPSLLMEPIINPRLPRDLDLTPAALRDVGWSPAEALSIGSTKLDRAELEGRKARYIVQIVNRSHSPATGVVVDHVPDAALVFESNALDCTGPFPCALDEIPSGQSRTLIVTYALPERLPKSVSQTFRITAGTPVGRASDSITTVVSSQASSGCGAVGASPGGGLTLLAVFAALSRMRRRTR